MKHTQISLTILTPLFLTLSPLTADTTDDLNTILGSAQTAQTDQASDSLSELPEAFQYALEASTLLFSDPLLQADSQYSLALALCEKGHTDSALDTVRKITSFHSAQGLGAIALKLAKQGNTDKAKSILSEALDRSESFLGWKRDRALTEIAETQAVLLDIDAANATIAKVIEELEKVRIKARVAAAIAIRTGEPGFEKDMKLVGSEKYYPEAAHQSRPFYAAAVYFEKNNEAEKARTLLLESAEIAAAANNNTQIQPLIEISEQLLAIGQKEDAGRIFAQTVDTAKSFMEGAFWKTDVYARIAVSMFKTGNAEEAANFLTKAEAFPDKLALMDRPQACIRIAEAWHQMGASQKAADWFLKAAKLASTNSNKRLQAHGAFLVSLSHASLEIPFSDALRTHLETHK